MLLQKCVHLESRLQTEQTPDVALREGTRTISFDSDRLERPPAEVRPLPFEDSKDVFRNINRHLHLRTEYTRLTRFPLASPAWPRCVCDA